MTAGGPEPVLGQGPAWHLPGVVDKGLTTEGPPCPLEEVWGLFISGSTSLGEAVGNLVLSDCRSHLSCRPQSQFPFQWREPPRVQENGPVEITSVLLCGLSASLLLTWLGL